MQKQKVYWICDRCFKEIEKPIIEYDYQYMYELCEECDKEFHQYENERKDLESSYDRITEMYKFGKYLPKEKVSDEE